MVYNHLLSDSFFSADDRLYERGWGQQGIRYLLKRSFFGIYKTQFEKFKTKKRSQIIYDLLHTFSAKNTFPLKDYLMTNANIPDSNIDFGKPWINDDNYDHSINQKRKDSLKNWFISKLYSDQEGLRPQMILFWNNFFSIELTKITFAIKAYNYFEIINRNALDNYKDLLIEMILDQTILHYVNKAKSQDQKLNEVFAEVILNEYTIGEKYFELIGKGKFRKLVRLLNEWSLISDSFALYSKKRKKNLINKLEYDSYLNTPVVKEFVIKLKMYFDFIFTFPEVSRNITKKIYQWFLHIDIDEEAEKKIIIPVSEIFASSKFDIKSLLNAFFLNEYFYNKKYTGCIIKRPIDFVFGICKEFNIYTISIEDTIKDYYYWNFLRLQIESLGQSIGDSEGHQGWPDSKFLLLRNIFVEKIFDSGIQCGSNTLKVDPVKFASGFNSPWDAHSLINESVKFLYGMDLSQNLKSVIKKQFLLDESDDESIWTLKWVNATKALKNEDDYCYVFNRLRELYKFLLKRPEYQLK